MRRLFLFFLELVEIHAEFQQLVQRLDIRDQSVHRVQHTAWSHPEDLGEDGGNGVQLSSQLLINDRPQCRRNRVRPWR